MRIFRLLGIYLTFTLSVTASLAAEDTQYFAVFMEGSKVGYALHTRIVADGKVMTTETVNMTISRLNIPITVNTTETSIETTDGKPLAFGAVQDLSGMSMNVKGTVDDQGVMQIMNSSMSGQQKNTLQWTNDAVMAEGLRLMELKKGLKEGLTYKAKIFSPSMLQTLDANITIGPRQKVDLLGRVVELTQVQTAVNMEGTGEVTTVTYVDKNLEMLKSVTPMMGMQIELVACEKEFAMAESGTFELADKMFLDSPIPLDNISSIPAISYHLTPIKDANGTGDTRAAKNSASPLNIPLSDNQMARLLDDGSVIVAVRPAIPQKGAKFPYKGSNEKILEAMKPTRFVQSDNSRIIDLAHQAVGDTKNAAEAAARIEAFVAKYIEKKSFSVGYASAAEVAVNREGDCSEFAVLTAAMCRAVGIPAQVAVGIAYVKNFASMEDQFGGHAWVQAYIGDKWIGLDSAFKSAGLGGFDAGHIALAYGNGDPADFFNLINTFGRFRIDKILVMEK